jgi:5-methylcytosine-specific restriction endonuclease McrA
MVPVNLTNVPVLVLNQNFEPLNICRVRRAVVLVLDGKAEVIENGRGELHAISTSVPIPSVVRLTQFVKRPRLLKRLTRFEVFNRDKFTCQYCGRETKDITLDHILPKSRGGTHEWYNVVGCCFACNLRKAGHTPAEAGMRLLRTPLPPRPTAFSVPHHYLHAHTEWQKFIAKAN